jgi:ubiquitin-like protein Nedd8
MNRVRISSDTEFEINIDPKDTVAQIKKCIHEQKKLPPQQTLIFGRKEMVDEKTADEYKLVESATVTLILSLRG